MATYPTQGETPWGDELKEYVDESVVISQTSAAMAADARDQAQAYRDEAHDISGISTSDGVVTALFNNAASATRGAADGVYAKKGPVVEFVVDQTMGGPQFYVKNTVNNMLMFLASNFYFQRSVVLQSEAGNPNQTIGLIIQATDYGLIEFQSGVNTISFMRNGGNTWYLYDAGSANDFFLRDMKSSRMHMSFYAPPSATVETASTDINSKLYVQGESFFKKTMYLNPNAGNATVHLETSTDNSELHLHGKGNIIQFSRPGVGLNWYIYDAGDNDVIYFRDRKNSRMHMSFWAPSGATDATALVDITSRLWVHQESNFYKTIRAIGDASSAEISIESSTSNAWLSLKGSNNGIHYFNTSGGQTWSIYDAGSSGDVLWFRDQKRGRHMMSLYSASLLKDARINHHVPAQFDEVAYFDKGLRMGPDSALDVKGSWGTPWAVPSSAFTTVPLDTVSYDAGFRWNNTTHVYSVPQAGTYLILAKIRMANFTPESESIGMGVDTTNMDTPSFQWQMTPEDTAISPSSYRQTFNYQRIMTVAANDELRLFVYADDTDLSIQNASMQIQRIG